jgi:HSP20 family molecular chaperone IbpA
MAEKTIEKGTLPVNATGDAVQHTREDERYLIPAVDIYETDDGLILVADVPGLNQKGLTVRVEDDLLTIRGKIAHQNRKNPTLREFQLADYWRQFQLGDRVNPDKIDAVLASGVLTLKLPWAEKDKPRQITVKVA